MNKGRRECMAMNDITKITYHFDFTDMIMYTDRDDVLFRDIYAVKNRHPDFDKRFDDSLTIMFGESERVATKYGLDEYALYKDVKVIFIDHKDHAADGQKDAPSNMYYLWDYAYFIQHRDYLKTLETVMFKAVEPALSSKKSHKPSLSGGYYAETVITNDIRAAGKEKAYVYPPILGGKSYINPKTQEWENPKQDYIQNGLRISKLDQGPEIITFSTHLRYKNTILDCHLYLLFAKKGTDKALIKRSQDYIGSIISGVSGQ
jgi:hypothetical protein